MRIAIYVATALIALTLVLPAEATVTLKEPIDRPDAGHPSGHEFEISKKDCENAQDIFEFNFTLANFSGKTLEAWLSTDSSLDCAVKEDRSSSEASHCVQIVFQTPGDDTETLSISSAEIAAKIDGVTGCNDSNPNTAARPITLWFMLLDSSGDVAADDVAKVFSTNIDLLGPAPPTELSAGLGSEVLIVSYTVPTGSDVDGFTVYCDPPPGGAAASTGATGTGVTAAGVGGGSGAGSCSSTLLVPGEIPASSLVSCGTAAKASATATAQGLTNLTSYAVAVSSRDVLGNVGELSEIVCGTPAPVDDFFDAYRSAGGKGGGCNVSDGLRDDVASFGLGGLGLGLAGLVLLARRASTARGARSMRRASR